MCSEKWRRAFTLIEMLVVIGMMAVLAAILFPVFARVRTNAHKAACASNLKQIGLAYSLYAQDYDDVLAPHQMTIQGPDWRALLDVYIRRGSDVGMPGPGLNRLVRDARERSVWVDPGRQGPPHLPGYGHNFAVLGGGWHSTQRPPGNGGRCPDSLRAVPFSVPLASVARPAETMVAACSTQYGRDPHVADTADPWPFLYPPSCWSGYPSSTWGAISGRHAGGANSLFVDGHVRWIRREQAYRDELFGL